MVMKQDSPSYGMNATIRRCSKSDRRCYPHRIVTELVGPKNHFAGSRPTAVLLPGVSDHFREFQHQQWNRTQGEQYEPIGKRQGGRLQEAAQGRVMLAPKLNTNREADDP